MLIMIMILMMIFVCIFSLFSFYVISTFENLSFFFLIHKQSSDN